MQRDAQAIEADIDPQRRLTTQSQQAIDQLEDELSRARAMTAADQRQRQLIARVLTRMEFGESNVSTPRAWWCRGGQLIERASADEINALFALQRQGLIGGRRAKRHERKGELKIGAQVGGKVGLGKRPKKGHRCHT